MIDYEFFHIFLFIIASVENVHELRIKNSMGWSNWIFSTIFQGNLEKYRKFVSHRF